MRLEEFSIGRLKTKSIITQIVINKSETPERPYAGLRGIGGDQN